MLGPRSIRTSIWATNNSSRLCYAQLFQQIKASDTSRYLSYTPASFQEEKEQQEQQQPWPQPAEPVVLGTQESSSASSFKSKLLPTSGIYSDLFGSTVEEPKQKEDGIPLYDSSIVDSSKNPSAEELKERIRYSLSQDPDNIYKFLSSSYLSNFEILQNRWAMSQQRFEGDTQLLRMTDYLSSENLSLMELVEINKVLSWQFKRWELLNKIREMMAEAQEEAEESSDTKKTFRENRLSKYRYLDFSKLQFLGLTKTDPVQRIRVATYILLSEGRYIRELIRLYQLTGIGELRSHVLATAPLINRVCRRLKDSYDERTDRNLIAPELVMHHFTVAHGASRSAFAYMIHSACPFSEIANEEGHSLQVPEDYLSPFKFVPIYKQLLGTFNDVKELEKVLKSPSQANQFDF